MKISQRFTALVLGGALLLSTAGFAATLEERFPAVQEFPGYSDVLDSDWYAPSAKALYEMGIMVGDGHGHFDPKQELTVAQCAAVAAVMHATGTGGVFEPTTPWYAGPMTYLTNVAKEQNDWSAVTLLEQEDPENAPITRHGFLLLLSLAADEEMLQPIRSVTSLPDTSDPTVLRFYSAGILSGKDKYGTFDGAAPLPRNECAVMAALLVRPELRLAKDPLADYSPFRAARTTPTTLFFPGVTAEAYLTEVNDLIASLEQVCRNNNMDFNWFNTYGDQTFLDYVKSEALTRLGADSKAGTEAYRALDLQEYYARLLAMTGAAQ